MGKTVIIFISIFVVLCVFVLANFVLDTPIKYWFVAPKSFEECVKASSGNIIKTLPAKCEFGGKLFVDEK